ncbi:glucan 1,3-alpha-glucosidase [Thermocladium modestius]|uniref:Glucan 1,3-alpha-glucosidase n=1 Tax=Thermocladium modestius TaxID=62609 RepID=A0A830GW08_9CREN|nr:glycoside hydrolase family 15 protein [Thermocladium modestius]GGP21414.1 glucan 1,3-alpha-glucosidase [Thermocladium modestius]
MVRYLVLGNGRLSAFFDDKYYLRELYYPLMGKENHSLQQYFRLGVWRDGFSWVHDFNPSMAYLEDALVSDVRINVRGIDLHINDVVDFVVPVLIRRISIGGKGKVRLFFTHDFTIKENDVGDTALFDPSLSSLIHYKDDRWFAASTSKGVDQYAVGYRGAGFEGTWRDCEDGELSGNSVAQGSVDSAMAVDAEAGEVVHYWLIAGQSYGDLEKLSKFVRERGPDKLLKRNVDYWRAFSNKDPRLLSSVPSDLLSHFKRGILAMMTHVNWNGGIIASGDTHVLRYFTRDTYAYVWHRDAALTALALDAAGYGDVTRRYYEFALSTIRNGYMFHRYKADGRWGSTWHSWVSKCGSLPIQEDETALVVYALWRHYEKYRDMDFVKDFYKPLVKDAGDFMVRYARDGLPLPSHDLWEERCGIHSWTVASVVSGLRAAAKFADLFGEDDKRSEYEAAANAMLGRFREIMKDRGLYTRGLLYRDGGLAIDDELDSSALGLAVLGAVDTSDPLMVNTVKAIEGKLWVNGVGGLARYSGDQYQRAVNGPGNPWLITTLWLAQWHALVGNAKRARELVDWAISKATPTGLLPEQVDGEGRPISVAPLTWSHAELVRTILMIGGAPAGI